MLPDHVPWLPEQASSSSVPPPRPIRAIENKVTFKCAAALPHGSYSAFTVHKNGAVVHKEQTELDLNTLAQSESVFALSNGHIGLRGNLDEGDPHGLPGTYLNSVYEIRPLPYAEAGYGYPESGQTIINVTNGKVIRLLVNDEPFDIRYGSVQSHTRTLDLRAGTDSLTGVIRYERGIVEGSRTVTTARASGAAVAVRQD